MTLLEVHHVRPKLAHLPYEREAHSDLTQWLSEPRRVEEVESYVLGRTFVGASRLRGGQGEEHGTRSAQRVRECGAVLAVVEANHRDPDRLGGSFRGPISRRTPTAATLLRKK